MNLRVILGFKFWILGGEILCCTNDFCLWAPTLLVLFLHKSSWHLCLMCPNLPQQWHVGMNLEVILVSSVENLEFIRKGTKLLSEEEAVLDFVIKA